LVGEELGEDERNEGRDRNRESRRRHRTLERSRRDEVLEGLEPEGGQEPRGAGALEELGEALPLDEAGGEKHHEEQNEDGGEPPKKDPLGESPPCPTVPSLPGR
jgi:hypothetical protein